MTPPLTAVPDPHPDPDLDPSADGGGLGLDALEAEADATAKALTAQLTQQEAGEGAGFEPAYASLEEWVTEVFAATFPRRATPGFKWCASWWAHAEAITRLEALWRSWEALRRDPLLGMATWLTSHLDPQLAALTAPAGPFADCDPSRHFDPDPASLPLQPAPAGWWPDPETSGA